MSQRSAAMLAAAGSRVLAAPCSRSIGQVAGSQRQASRPAARRPLPPAAATSSSSGSTDPFSAAFKRAGSGLEEWVKQQRLNERLNSGLGAAGRAAKQAADEAQRTARKVRRAPGGWAAGCAVSEPARR